MTPERVLVFQTAYLGDAILAIPLLKALRFQFPKARLGFVCRQGVGPIFTESHTVDEAIEVDKSDSVKLREAFERSKAFRPDLIVSPHRSFRTALWVWRLAAPMSVGFKDPWSFFAYKKRVRRPSEKHDVLRQLSLMEGLGADHREFDENLTNMNVDIPVQQRFSAFSDFVAMAPGSQWETKRWTSEGFVKVGQTLKARGEKVVILGSSNERDLCERISSEIGATNLCGQTTILELAQVLKMAKCLICNDSGTMHVATAMGTPVVTVFGATVPSQGYAPWSKRAKIVEVNLSCRPCGAHGHSQCPLGHHNCMKQISAEMVLKAAEGFIS